MAFMDYGAVERDVKEVIAGYLDMPVERITPGLGLGETDRGLYLSKREMRTLSSLLGKEFGVPAQAWSNTTVSIIARYIGNELSISGSEKARKYETDESTGDRVYDKAVEVTIEQFGVDLKKITPETDFIRDLGGDSLDIVELKMEFEDAFGMKIPDTDFERIHTVGDAVNYIKSMI